MNIMKKYIQPTAEIFNYSLEGTIALSLTDKKPAVDGDGNQFSNFRDAADWDDEF